MRVLDEVKSLRGEVQALAARVASFESRLPGTSAPAATKPAAPARKAAARKPAAAKRKAAARKPAAGPAQPAAQQKDQP